ncbi:MarR family winged helix-turn-helix transcriptional regulator [Pseudogemmobacter sp. W21_MBD1_M6]|uniref:MarR family winged helix-turn-helix transcriptional regulator n=1 Tax=Pseudogemmobacter sp. W21_MBD1_M6 TaxID=3240271 RepID=UPI003F9646F5
MTESIPLSDMPGHLIRRLNQVSASVFQDRVKAAGYDLTSVQFAAMNTVRQNPGVDQATLASLIAYDRATIGGVVERLERKGLVTRSINKEDRRARALWLTEDGQATLDRIGPVVRGLQDDILGSLTASEREQFIALAQKALRPDEKAQD